jgi:predicted metal-dependent phosphoesterase TrpH
MRDALLLCELHAHSTWSDGYLTLPELVDLYGESGFDVLCVTDHARPLSDPSPARVDPWTWPSYLESIGAEAERAWAQYELLLIPGLELTEDHDDAVESAHVLALGIERHPSLENGLVLAIEAAEAQGAALVAAHPYSPNDLTPYRPTLRIWHERELFRDLVHRFELFNRFEVFSWVASERLPFVATGDNHRAEHVSSWKTLLPCPKDARAVVDHLRSDGRVYLTPYAAERSELLPAAA